MCNIAKLKDKKNGSYFIINLIGDCEVSLKPVDGVLFSVDVLWFGITKTLYFGASFSEGTVQITDINSGVCIKTYEYQFKNLNSSWVISESIDKLVLDYKFLQSLIVYFNEEKYSLFTEAYKNMVEARLRLVEADFVKDKKGVVHAKP